MIPEVDKYLRNAKIWQHEMQELRRILLDCGLNEVFKWRQPCYLFKKSNVLIIGSLKEYCVLTFFKGSLMKDINMILVKPGENSQSSRYIKFTSVAEIVKIEPVIKRYIYEAIELEKSGLKVDFKAKRELVYPEEFQRRLIEIPNLKTAFEKLTPGRQRAYNLYFSAPKQSKTRDSRIEKYIPKILSGIGINDCTCGRSKRMPTCDGSHKYI